jgi:hypothetical protein
MKESAVRAASVLIVTGGNIAPHVRALVEARVRA